MHLYFDSNPYNLNIENLSNTARVVLKKHKPELLKLASESLIPIHFITDAQIQVLNKQYRNKDKPTDVLSWSFIDENLLPNEIAGEIYISTETAKKQALQQKKSIHDTVTFLIVHGLLHIFHYEHDSDEQELEMDNVTDEILKNFLLNS